MTTDLNSVSKRRYTVAEILELIDILKFSDNISAAELKGIEKLGQMLKELELMSDADIETEVRRFFRSETNQSS